MPTGIYQHRIGVKSAHYKGGKIENNCLVCGKIFEVNPSVIKRGSGKYCSGKCYGKKRNKKIVRNCLICNKQFKTLPCEIRKSGGKFCSRKCVFISFKGHIGYLKGKHHSKLTKKKISDGNKGKIVSRKSRIKMGIAKRGIKIPKITGKNNINWKGDDVGYNALHSWVKRSLGFPNVCEYCGKIGKTIYYKDGRKRIDLDWANKSGLYLRNDNDWIRLCVNCHRKYDKTIVRKKYNKYFENIKNYVFNH